MPENPLVDDVDDLWIRPDAHPAQLAAELPEEDAYVAARTQRPVADVALNQMLLAGTPAWKAVPSWFVLGPEDRSNPVARTALAALAASRTVVA
jgi:hypothetical protein